MCQFLPKVLNKIIAKALNNSDEIQIVFKVDFYHNLQAKFLFIFYFKKSFCQHFMNYFI